MLKCTYGEAFRTPCTLVLGGFDGLHLGHRVLLRQAQRYGDPVGITTVLGGKGKTLFTMEEREFLFARAGIGLVYEISFTEQVKNTPAEQFLAVLFQNLCVTRAVCGEDFRFGKDALGTPELLKRIAPCPVFVQEIVKSDYLRAEREHAGMRKISSSVCKEHLKKGELSLLNSCLYGYGDDFYGGAYFVGGVVEHGREVGRTYGFPTLNLSVREEKLLPPDGVYGGLASTPSGNFPCIINLGDCPTFGVKEKKLEAYLDGFSGNLYGAYVRVYPMEFYRGIDKFPSPAALREQLQRDIARLRAWHI